MQHAKIAAQVPADLAREFTAFAANRERTLSAELRIAMREHLSKTTDAVLGGDIATMRGGSARHGATA